MSGMNFSSIQSVRDEAVKSIRSRSGKPRIMLSGFNVDEIKKYANIIETHNAIYECDNKRPQSYMASATHLVSKSPSRCEKYLAATIAGKWVLKPSFLENELKNEELHAWGNAVNTLQSKSIQALEEMPVKWRKKLRNGGNGPFRNWKIGLFVTEHKIETFKAIVEAGEGTVVFVFKKPFDIVDTCHLITHVFCSPECVKDLYKYIKFDDVSVFDEAMLTSHIMSIGTMNLKDCHLKIRNFNNNEDSCSSALSMELKHEFLINHKDPKLSQSVPKIILFKEKVIPKQVQDDQECNEKEVLSNEFINLFISQNSAFIQDVVHRLNIAHSATGLIENLGFMNFTNNQLYRECDAIPFDDNERKILEGNVDGSQDNVLLLGVETMTTKKKYPPRDIIFCMMCILSDATSSNVAYQAYSTLRLVLSHHPPQAKHIKKLNLYQDSILTYINGCQSEYVMEETNEFRMKLKRKTSSLNKHGPLWHFFSEIIQYVFSNNVVDESKDGRLHHSILLLKFLVLIVKEDYQFVIESIKASETPETCFLADLLWMRKGASYSAETQDSVLQNMIELLIKAKKNLDAECVLPEVVNCLSQLVYISTSWAIHIDDLQRDVLLHQSIKAKIINLFADACLSNDMSVTELESLMRYIPLSIRPDIIAKILDSWSSDILVNNKQYNNKSKITLSVIVNYYMQLIPKIYNEIKKTEFFETDAPTMVDNKTLEQKVYNTITPKVVKKVNKRNPKGETPLLVACRTGNVESVRLLLQTPGIDASLPDFYGWTPLGEACNYGHIDCVKELLKLPLKCRTSGEPGLEIDLLACPKALGDTPLHDVIETQKFDIAKLLLEKGGLSLLEVYNAKGYTPMDVCPIDFLPKLVDLVEHTRSLHESNISAKPVADIENMPLLSSIEMYAAVHSQIKQNSKKLWHLNVNKMCDLIVLLLKLYSDYSEMFSYRDPHFSDIESEILNTNKNVKTEIKSEESTEPSATILAEHKSIESNISIALRWSKHWSIFNTHLKRLLKDPDINVPDPLHDVMLQVFEEF